MSSNIIFYCPHCKLPIEKNIFDLAINNIYFFRHGIYIENNKNIDFNLTNSECYNLFINNKIFGCGKKYKIINKNYNYIIK